MFTSIELRRVRGIDVTIPLPKGITCLLGPNGAGKSTTIESMCFALFGTGALRGKVKEILPGRQSAIVVKGTFPQPFTIQRTPKHSSLELTDGRQFWKTTEISSHFADVFGHRDVFLNVFVAPQGSVSNIATIKNAARRKVLIELLGLASLSDTIQALCAQTNGLQPPATSVEAVLKELDQYKKLANGATLSSLSKAVQVRQELSKTDTLTVDPIKARQGLELVTTAIQTANQRLGDVTRFLRLKEGICKELNTNGSTECPICYSSIIPLDVKTQLTTDIGKLQTELNSVHTEIKKLASHRDNFATAARYKTRGEILADAGDVLTQIEDPEACYQAALRTSKLEQMATDVEKQWIQYTNQLPIKDLGNHLKEFLSHILVKYFNRLRTIVSEYLIAYTRFRKFDLTESFDMLVDGRGIWTLSGGERDLVCTILRVALTQVVSEARFGCCPIIIFDSAFDSIDEKHMSRILEMLQESPFEQIIITHHNSQLRSKMDVNYVHLGEV